MAVFLLSDRCFQRDRFLGDLEDFANLGHRDVHPFRDFFRRRLATQFLHECARRSNELVDRLDHVDRDPDRAGLVGDRACDGLPDPPGRVRREFVAAAILELVDRLHQPDVAFLDQIEELEAPVGVLLRDRHDEAEVGLDQFLLGELGQHVAT